jgi:hypothetical protein
MNNNQYPSILQNIDQLEPFPKKSFRRVDQPTTAITEDVQRIDLRDIAYGLAARGEYGPAVQKGVQKSLPDKYPFSAALKDVIDHISLMEVTPVAPQKAPIPQEPEILTRT